MKLFGMLIPSYRKGTYVIVSEPACVKGKDAELLYSHLDSLNKYKRNSYGMPKRDSKGMVVSLMKSKNASGDACIYYGVVIKDILYAIEEKGLARA